MTDNSILLERNKQFAANFAHTDMQALPKLGTIIVGCIDARVDPAYVLGLELGDCVVLRNTGGRVSRAVIEEVTALAVLVAKITQAVEANFHVVLMQHTKCGAQQLANPDFQASLKQTTGVDVSEYAITDQESDLITDINRLRDAKTLPGSLKVSALLYDVDTGVVTEVVPPRSLLELRAS